MASAREYELIVKALLQMELQRHHGPERPTVLHRRSYSGASGQAYEIDLSFELHTAGGRMLVLAECKCYERPVGVDDVTEFAYKVRDIGANKGMVITPRGFQRGALKVAKREGIALVRAVSRWYVIMHDRDEEHFAPYMMQERDPKTGNFDPSRLRFPKGKRYRYPADLTCRVVPLDTREDVSRVAFVPALEGFHGDPMDALSAAVIFCEESDIDPGVMRVLARELE